MPDDFSTGVGWIDYLAAHRGDCALVVRALDGTVILRNAVVPMPAASAIKLVHLAALAEQVDYVERQGFAGTSQPRIAPGSPGCMRRF